METTIKVSSDFRNKIAKIKSNNQTYQAFFEQILEKTPQFSFDNDYPRVISHKVNNS